MQHRILISLLLAALLLTACESITHTQVTNPTTEIIFTQATTTPTETPTEPEYIFDPENIQWPIEYEDTDLTLTIDKDWYEDTWVFAAHIQLKDYTRFFAECANGLYDSGTEPILDAAARVNALLMANGSESTPKELHCFATHGEIQAGFDSSCWVPAYYNQNDGMLYTTWELSPNGQRVGGERFKDLVENGIISDTFTASPPIVENGSIKDADNIKRDARTFMGSLRKPGDLWLVVSHGNKNDGESLGLTYEQCAEYLIRKNCNFVVPLKSGPNCAMVYQGAMLTSHENPVEALDFVAIGNLMD